MEGQHSGNRWEPTTPAPYTPSTAPTPPATAPTSSVPTTARPAGGRARILAVAGLLAVTTAGGFVVTRAVVDPDEVPAYVSPSGVTDGPGVAGPGTALVGDDRAHELDGDEG